MTTSSQSRSGNWNRLVYRLFSMPIFFKILGIGVLVATLFGAITLLLAQASITRALCEVLEQRTRSIGRTLADSFERPMITGDTYTIHEKVQQARRLFPDVRYLIVEDQQGRIVAHTFQAAVPSDLLRVGRNQESFDGTVQVLASDEGKIFDASFPILEGQVGRLRVGVSDISVQRETSSLMRSILWGLVFCVVVGTCLAILLSLLLTRPIHRLVDVANQLGGGDFDVRADVAISDEIGQLANAFNRMAAGLQSYKNEVEEKERIRVHLLERTVQAQEEERKTIARELHDQMGQSLLDLLLTVQASCKSDATAHEGCHPVESKIRGLVDEVHRLAWGMHPSILDDYGLDSALARYAEEMSRQFKLAVDYQYMGSADRLPARIEVTLYRVAQEAITNAMRHSRAGRASVILVRQRSEVTLLVEDDGCGFDPALLRGQDGNGMGLRGMQERAALLGGTTAIESAPGRGTTIRVRIPLEQGATDEAPPRKE